MKDTLFLLDSAFSSETGEVQFCPDTMLIEGVVARFPELVADIDIVRVPFTRPRAPIVALVGEENQGCPVLVRQDDAGNRPVSDVKGILTVLRDEYGIPSARNMI